MELLGECVDTTNLTILNLGYNLGYNQHTGEIPSTIVYLTNLTSLYLNANQLTGEIPSWIGSLTSLVHLRLDVNNSQESFSSELGNSTNLTTLYLYDNLHSQEKFHQRLGI